MPISHAIRVNDSLIDYILYDFQLILHVYIASTVIFTFTIFDKEKLKQLIKGGETLN